MTRALHASPLLLLAAALVALAVFFLDSMPVVQAELDSTNNGICDRTQEVQNAILGELTGVSDCTNVTDSHLASITELIEWRFTSAQDIKSSDFAGLSGLTDLELISDEISALPEDIFEGLGSLEYLLISIGKLQSLPDDVFDGLGSLKELKVGKRSFRLAAEPPVPDHQLTTLPEDVFDGLGSLETLNLVNNQLGALPEDVFDGLSSLEILALNLNQIAALPEDVSTGSAAYRNCYWTRTR